LLIIVLRAEMNVTQERSQRSSVRLLSHAPKRGKRAWFLIFTAEVDACRDASAIADARPALAILILYSSDISMMRY